ncbi:1-acyl-sn-glycerol-3-phosphate acyltransferase [Stappia sp. F7233]|uniref:1-acyl-sn-glycerol-3-phosphate acyltransferase n=2 Tax=Stappia albiluteola TaxID=2758565 RepID=A0A839AI34_9HYPH|nr:1-acyl-sn-glycerol-3-phosphate acyltransferase [Stappia albiluteola]
MLALRSLLFNIFFYLFTLTLMVVGCPLLLLPRHVGWPIVPFWAHVNLWVLKHLVGMKVEVRGRENIPEGGFIVAAKHQSALETFALIPEFRDPTYILKRELRYIPLFGWYTMRMKQIPVDRGKRSVALAAMTEKAREAVAEGRQILIFPEGTRRPAGAEPHYKYGVAHLYRQIGCPVLPVALNTGIFWPRRGFYRYPGKVVFEILPPIEPGLGLEAFASTLTERVETVSDRLIEETAAAYPDLPVLDRVAERWRERGRMLRRN